MQAERPVLSTKGTAQPFAFWHDVVCQRFTDLDTEPVTRNRFSGAIRADRQLGTSTLSTIAASAQVVKRTKHGIARRPCGAVFVNFQRFGTCAVEVNGMETLLKPGDIAVLDADRPFAMRFDRTFRQSCIHLDHKDLPHGADWTGTVLRRAQTDKFQFRALFDGMRTGRSAHDALGAVLSVIGTTAERTRHRQLSKQHLALIKTHIAQNCDDPALTVDGVAQHFRISKRHVHNLFALSGETFMQFLIYRRVRLARQRIEADPKLPLSAIAADCGFQTPSHFSRLFSKTLGRSPKAWQKMIR